MSSSYTLNVLKELGSILLNYCRPKDHVFRNGGEEFSLLLANCSNTEALATAEKIRNQVEQRSFDLLTGEQIKITISIGVATYPETVKDLRKLHENADNALYEAKRTGRNKVCN
ncbi:MAG: GGDEF domain-containing protein [Mobilitalea sp.]